ncbi:hypothetical protein QBC38DRAFT_487575 [Podospora fimiseda]|uniref:Uncharacterized protein n=1 Tax=Podospora fimiseda TaxID=252190 RepID=A0AAN7BHI7_9PEZI|nr:hypothetical protein QBC38DRAFT_487575 [Podospora fimiseda]
MCGPETPSNLPRIGARVDLPIGNLLFLNPSNTSSSHATHVRFHTSTQLDSELLVSIHITGDLSKPLADSGLLQQFTLPIDQISSSDSDSDSENEYEIPLQESVSLIVGEGIIGRRVSMMTRENKEVLGEGIVGYNFMPTVRRPSL